MSRDESALARMRDAFIAPGAVKSGCAEPGRIWDAAVGALPPAEARSLVAHSVSCADCAVAWRLAREAASEAGLLTTAERPVAILPRFRVAAVGAAAAAAAAALLLVPVLRKPVHEPALRSVSRGQLRALSPASLPRQNLALRWSGAPTALRYAVTVTTRDLTVVHEARGLTAPQAVVPEAALARLPAGTELFWTVEAFLPDGSRVSSGAFLVRLE